MFNVRCLVNPASLKRAQEVLDADQYRGAIWQATKRTGGKSKSAIRQQIEKLTNINKKYVGRAVAVKMQNRDPAPPIARVEVSHLGIPAIGFRPFGAGMKMRGKRKPGGITFKPYKAKPALRFRSGFAAVVNQQNATDESETHLGVFIRQGVSGRRGKSSRFPIKQLYGPSVEGVMEKPEALAVVEQDLSAEFEKQLNSQLDRFLK